MSQRNTADTGDSFTITHKQDGAANIVTITPTHLKALVNYGAVNIELTDDQWSALKYHFATMVNDKEKLTKLAYIY